MMISLIICSQYSDISENLKKNIQDTIGYDYELIVINNSASQYSIFSAYNEGIKRAKGDILCFMHEDILFRTKAWGEKVVNHFSDETIGLLGFAGTHFLPSVPSYWLDSPFISEYNLTNNGNEVYECIKTDFFNSNNLIDVVACDGFCFFIRKELFTQIQFDDVHYDGFHFYDMDICMQILNTGFRVCLCKDILIEHEWVENLDKQGMHLFEYTQQLFFDKWKHKFPITIGIDHIPSFVTHRINNLFIAVEEGKKARKSYSYRIGKYLITPLRSIKNLLKKH